MDYFQNYKLLLEKVDSRCAEIFLKMGDQMACGKGCDGCCRHISLFPLEAVFMASHMSSLPEESVALLRSDASSAEDVCPVLKNQLCRLYSARPIICRTHGFPILTPAAAGAKMDICPLNTSDGFNIDPSLCIDLETLNQILVSVNQVFLEETGLLGHLPDRISVADAIFMDID